MKNPLLWILLSFILNSCATPPQREVKIKPDYTVAVLPLYNATNDVNGPILVRKVFNKRIHRNYKTMSLNEIDRTLRDKMGITHGEQLDIATPQKLGEVLGVDGVVYGYLLNFDDITTGVYNVRKVRAGFKLVDTRTGRTLWAKGKGVRRVSGFADFGSLAPLEDKEPIKGTEDIQGIKEWLTLRADVLSLGAVIGGTQGPTTSIASEDVSADQVLFTFFLGLNPYYIPLGSELVERVGNIHLITETSLLVNKVVDSLDKATVGFASVPRLIFPTYSVFGDRDFSAGIVITMIAKTTQESVRERVELAKWGDKLRSDRVSEWDKPSIIVKRDEKKIYFLYHDKKEYFEMGLDESFFKKTEIAREYVGEEKVEDQLCDKYKVMVTYRDGLIQEGYIWEAKSLKGFPIKAAIEDKDTRIIVEFRNVSLLSPAEFMFKPPDDYSRID